MLWVIKNTLAKNQDCILSNLNKNYLWNKLSYNLKYLNFEKKGLKNASFLITGGTGYVGSWIVHSLAALNYLFQLNIDVTLILKQKKNLNKYFFLKKIIKINYLLSDINKIKDLDSSFTHLIHGSGVNNRGTKSDILKTNFMGTKNIIKILKKNKIENIIYISSGAVYKNNNKKLNLKEKNTLVNLESKNYYSIAKIKSEKLLTEYYDKNKNTNLTILRLFSFAGPGLDSLKYLVYYKAIRSKYKNKDIKLNSDGKSTRSFMHSIDMATWIIKSLTFKKKNIINVGSDEKLTIYEMSKIISNLNYKNFKKINIKVSQNNKDNSFYVPSLNNAYKKNLKNKYNLKDAIKDHLYHKMITTNPHRYYF